MSSQSQFPLILKFQLREEFKFKRSLLKVYVELFKKSDYNRDGKVTLNEWMAWITQKKQIHDRKKWFLNPGKSFIFIVSMIQLIIGLASRWEKHIYCACCEHKNHPTCPNVRPFHDAMIFKSCLRFETWRYVTYAFVHHGLPHLATNLTFQMFFGKFIDFYFLVFSVCFFSDFA